MDSDQEGMREAYKNIFGREWESEPILLREFDSAQQSGFQAAYQLQQARIEELEKTIERMARVQNALDQRNALTFTQLKLKR